jgi:hypothetical protein
MTSYLPPLPELPGTENYRPLGESILDVLATEHRFLEAMCADVRDERGRDATDVLVAVLCRHLSAERQYLYATVAKAVPGGASAADTRLRADDELLAAAAALLRAEPSSPDWQRALAALRMGIAGHRTACDETLFAPLRATLSQSDLVRLGNRVEMALESAPTRPHPGAPARTPWIKLTDPVLGALDKFRDLFTRRATYPPPAQEAARRRLRTRHIPITQS